MTRLLFISFILFLSFTSQNLFSQFKMDFGNITIDELSNQPYLPDLDADAVILSDVGVAFLNHSNGFYIQLERDVKIRIINSNGFDYADIEIPFSSNAKLINFRASTFNIRTGEKIETIIPEKNFIIEESSKYSKVLKFNFPDVHEGSVIEYSYIMKYTEESIVTLVPWVFQTSIPKEYTSLEVSYPEYFAYKYLILGNPMLVDSKVTTQQQRIGQEYGTVITSSWSAANVPAFNDEPFIKSIKDNQTRLSFELASINFPNSSFEEISPTYATLTKKLMARDDFGGALRKALFLKRTAENLTYGLHDDLSKLKAIHKYVSENILWDGYNGYTTSYRLQKAFNVGKGNSADINMILIAMLRHVNIEADPVILSTRSNGNLNEHSAMLQQFNYLVAIVNVKGNSYLVDATNPLRPFDILPFECLNGLGRQISENESRFVALNNSETFSTSTMFDLTLNPAGIAEGNYIKKSKGYSALNIREMVRLKGEEGYSEKVRSGFSESDSDSFVLNNISHPDSTITETCKIEIEEGIVAAGDKILIGSCFFLEKTENPFSSPERAFPIDFGCPIVETFSMSLKIPDQYIAEELPENITYSLGTNDITYIFSCFEIDNRIEISGSLLLKKTSFSPEQYSGLRDFFTKMYQSQERLIVLKKRI